MAAEREKAQRRQRHVITVAIVVVVVLLVAVGGYAISSASKDSDLPVVQPRHAGTDHFVTVDAQVLGGKASPDAVPVDLYVDLQCPTCKAFEAAYGARLEKLVTSGEIELRYKVVTFLDGQSTTRYSTRAANTAMCVLDHEGVADFYTLLKQLYVDQPAEGTAGLSDDELAQAAATATGSDGAAVTKCIDDRRYEGWLDQSTEQFKKADITGTPTMLVDGKRVDVSSFENIEAAIKAAA